MDDSQIIHCLKGIVNMEDVAIHSYSECPFGKKVVDQSGDYIVFFYHAQKDQVMYFFKGLEKYWFSADSLALQY